MPILDAIAEAALRKLVPPGPVSPTGLRTRYGRQLVQFAWAHRALKDRGFMVDARRLDNFLLWWGCD
jgi:hypothetical protein